MATELVCLDLTGTTVADDEMVERAFAEAIATQGVVPGTSAYAKAMVQVHRARGCPGISIFRELFPEEEAQAQAANVAFEHSYDSAIDRMGLSPLPGAEETIDKLADGGMKVCLTTGFGRTTLGRILDTLGWWDRVDLALCPEDAGRGRPAPDLVLAAVLRLEIDDVRDVAVIGDTAAGILSGRRAGASVAAGVLSGVHGRERLVEAGATQVLDTVAELPHVLIGSTAATGSSESSEPTKPAGNGSANR